METLVDLVQSVGADAEWTGAEHARHPRGSSRRPRSDPVREDPRVDPPRRAAPRALRTSCSRRRAATSSVGAVSTRTSSPSKQLGATVSATRSCFARRAHRRRRLPRRAERDGNRERPRPPSLPRGRPSSAMPREPHVQDLANFLVALGARIEGIGTNTMTIHGGARSRGHAPDRSRSHRGRLVHRTRRGHAFRDHHREPVSSICARP